VSSLEEEAPAEEEGRSSSLGFVWWGSKTTFSCVVTGMFIVATIHFACVSRGPHIALLVLSILSWVRLEWNFGFKDLYTMLRRCWEGGEQETNLGDFESDDVNVGESEIEFGLNPLHQEETAKEASSEKDARDSEMLRKCSPYMKKQQQAKKRKER